MALPPAGAMASVPMNTDASNSESDVIATRPNHWVRKIGIVGVGLFAAVGLVSVGYALGSVALVQNPPAQLPAYVDDDDEGEVEWTGLQAAAVCAPTCAAEFTSCHGFWTAKKGKKCGCAYKKCRKGLDKGKGKLSKPEFGCTPGCANTPDMAAMKDGTFVD